MICVCGSFISIKSRARHDKTIKHLEYINNSIINTF
jgi:hypothetical protein